MSRITELQQTSRHIALLHPGIDSLQAQNDIDEIIVSSEYATTEGLLKIALSVQQFQNYGIPPTEDTVFNPRFSGIPRILRLVSVAQLALRASSNADRSYPPNSQSTQDKSTLIIDPMNAMYQLNRLTRNSIPTGEILSNRVDDPFLNDTRNNTISTRRLLLSQQFSGSQANPHESWQAIATQMLYLRAKRAIRTTKEDLESIDITLVELARYPKSFQN